MNATRAVAAIVLASLLVGAFPGTARAEQPPAGIRASIDGAVAKLAPQPPVKKSKDSTSHAAQAAYGGGGGGKGMLIVTLVTTVVGLGATYYMIKEMQKQTAEQK